MRPVRRCTWIGLRNQAFQSLGRRLGNSLKLQVLCGAGRVRSFGGPGCQELSPWVTALRIILVSPPGSSGSYRPPKQAANVIAEGCCIPGEWGAQIKTSADSRTAGVPRAAVCRWAGDPDTHGLQACVLTGTWLQWRGASAGRRLSTSRTLRPENQVWRWARCDDTPLPLC